MKTSDYSAADVQRLVLAAREAALQIDAEVFSIKHGLRTGDANGALRPLERKASALKKALAAFGISICGPAGLC